MKTKTVKRFPKFRIFLIFMLPIGFLAVGFIGFKKLSNLKKPPTKKELVQNILKVDVIELHSKEMTLDITGYGTVRSQREVDLTSEISGKVVKINPAFKPGGFVEKDQVLIELDARDYQIAMETSKADVNNARSEVERLKKQKIFQKRTVELLRKKTALSEKDYKRQQTSRAKGYISDQKIEQALAALLQEQNTLNSNEESLGTLPAQISKARASLEKYQAALEKARYNMDRLCIKAPFCARVLSQKVELGQSITTGMNLGRLAYDKIYEIPVMVNQDEMYKIPNLLKGGTMQGYIRTLQDFTDSPDSTVQWLNYKGRFTWPGKLVRIEPIDSGTQTLPFIVAIEDPWKSSASTKSPPLMIGYYCRVTIKGERLKGVFAAPESAIQEDDAIYLLRNGKLAMDKVTIIQRLEDEVAFLPFDKSVSYEGALLITSSIAYPIPGMPLEQTSN